MSEYQVLARKYRPKKLSELVGQDVLVKTLSSAIRQNRIPHAFILTGIRGVGKTSTARIIARSLLCTSASEDKPTIEPCGVCANCISIQNDNHVDVIEVDAASRTGVGDIREIIDQVAYSPVMGRFKIYIIDEVHMLSKNAFNALLKTLEEPPSHVKFIFATTEIRKIPVTILSRCMRFDLPRVSVEKLAGHFKNVAANEKVNIDDDALKIIANAAEGSVRDGLSLLDQAIAVSSGEDINAEKVRSMLGLADRDQMFTLLKDMLEGNFIQALQNINEIYAKGNDPVLLIKDLLEITHSLTLSKVSPDILNQKTVPESEKKRSVEILKSADLAHLTRIWQVLNKGIEEARFCPSPLMAAEMVVIRACYASTLPSPEAIIRKLDGENDNSSDETSPSAFDEQPTMFAEKKTIESAKSGFSEQKSSVFSANSPAISSPRQVSKTTYPSANAATATSAAVAIPEERIVNIAKEQQNFSVPVDYASVVKLFEAKKEALIASELRHLKLVEYNPEAETGIIKFITPATPLHTDVKHITKKLAEWTGKRFMLSFENSIKEDVKSINDVHKEELEIREKAAINSPAVTELLKEFAGATITEVKEIIE